MYNVIKSIFDFDVQKVKTVRDKGLRNWVEKQYLNMKGEMY